MFQIESMREKAALTKSAGLPGLEGYADDESDTESEDEREDGRNGEGRDVEKHPGLWMEFLNPPLPLEDRAISPEDFASFWFDFRTGSVDTSLPPGARIVPKFQGAPVIPIYGKSRELQRSGSASLVPPRINTMTPKRRPLSSDSLTVSPIGEPSAWPSASSATLPVSVSIPLLSANVI